jgi:hypothetical protein
MCFYKIYLFLMKKNILLLVTFLFFIPEILADKRAPKGQCYISIGYVSDRDSVTEFAKKSFIKAKDFELFERKDKKVYLTLGKIDKNIFNKLESEGETYNFNCSSGKGYEERFGLNSEFQIVGGNKINIISAQQFMSVVSSIEIEKQRLIDIEVEKQVQARLAAEKEKQRLAKIEEQRKAEAAAEVERQVQARVAELEKERQADEAAEKEKQRLAKIEEQRKAEAAAEVERQADEAAEKEKQRLAKIEEQRKAEAEKQIQTQSEEREQIKKDDNILYYDCKQPVDNTALEYSRAVLLQIKPDTKNFRIKVWNDSKFSHQEFDGIVYSFDTNGNLLKDEMLGLRNKTHSHDANFFWDDVTNLLGLEPIYEIDVDEVKKQLFLGVLHKFNCKEVKDKDKTEAAVKFVYNYTDKFINETPKTNKEVPKINKSMSRLEESPEVSSSGCFNSINLSGEAKRMAMTTTASICYGLAIASETAVEKTLNNGRTLVNFIDAIERSQCSKETMEGKIIGSQMSAEEGYDTGILFAKGYAAQLQIGSGITQSEVNERYKGCAAMSKHYGNLLDAFLKRSGI